MSITLTDYKILPTPLYEGYKTVIFRGEKASEATNVIVKTLKAEYPTLEEMTRLRHEYRILQDLESEQIIKSIALENYQNNLALILEDFSGKSLKEFLAYQTLEIPEFLAIAIQLATALETLHHHQIIHKDIKPHNILINAVDQTIKIIDFSISSRLSKETPTISNPDLIEGTLAYMSPEQTGRMNRVLDYRTDFYSLGITFYEMLTGSLPFHSTDPLEIIHYHIAKQPLSPLEIVPEIPAAISAIVMKLMAKNAEDRYQSATGLKVDLQECLFQLKNQGKIENFIPGQRDQSGQFIIPQKLYGRETEVLTLIDAFERVSTGHSELMLVSGYSGVGKSCLVHEIHKPIVREKGYFIAGKFDQYKRNIPYAAMIQAFQELIRQLLTEKAEILETWKEKILAAVGPNGQAIIDVIPELELIIGKQDPLPELGPTEAQNRFNRLFKEFIHVFTKKDHPLVIFLDDLQWADSASLNLLQLLMNDADSQYLLTIGAYRDNEVNATHPLMITLGEIESQGAVVHAITLQPLNFENVVELITETVHEANRSTELAELVYNKTQGNPFFLTQLLQTLYIEKLLYFDFFESRWLWNIENIQAIGITDYTVVQLVARNIQKLSEKTQRILQLAACIGNRFTLDVLSIVSQQSVTATANDLWEALQAGFVLPLSNNYKIPLFFDQKKQGNFFIEDVRVSYKFLHDRVQQAAYSLIPEDEKKATHLKIGQLLLQKTAKYALEDNIFDIVNQLNIGVTLIDEESERNKLSQLNLLAGKKAKMATAYEAAAKYLKLSLDLLAANSWETHYELTLDLYLHSIEAEYLNTNFVTASNLAEVALTQANTLLDQVKVYEAQIQIDISQWQMLKAIETGLEVLSKLEVSLASLTGDDSLAIALPSLADLESIPPMTDPKKLWALRILKTICAPIFMAKPEIFPQVILTMIHLCIESGNSSLSAFAYGFYGLLLAGMGKIDAGYHAGKLALKLLEQFDAKELKAKVYNLFNANIRTWKEHARNSVSAFQEGVQSGLETGDIEWASYCGANYCSYLFFTEERLDTVVQQQLPYIELLRKLKLETALQFANIWRQVGLNLMGNVETPTLLAGESFNETQTLPLLIESKSGTGLFMFHVAKTILFYQFKDYAKAIHHAELATEQAGSAFGFIQVAVLNFYESLALLAQYPYASEGEQKEYLKRVCTNQEKLKYWAENAPANFQHKYALVEAEKARILGDVFVAMDWYEQAVQGAKEQHYLQEMAIASELAAEFYFSHDKNRIAKDYLIESYYTYIRWGSQTKVRDLEERYPDFFAQLLSREAAPIDLTRTTTSTTGTVSAVLDLAAVTKASQAISSEIVLDKLLETLMYILVENAGARKGFLVFKKDHQWVLVAQRTVEDNSCLLFPSDLENHSVYLPYSTINYIERTRKTVVLNNAIAEGLFSKDPYIQAKQVKSFLGMPLIQKGELTGILILENDLTVGAFTQERLEVLKTLTSQVAISIENANLYTDLQNYSHELELKNSALSAKTLELEQAFYRLQQTQAQLVQTEKISSLGQLVAGVAHEVNNPVSFINGNLHHATEYTQALLDHVALYQQVFAVPPAPIQEHAAEIELEYLCEDLPKILSSMKVGTERIREIMQSLRNFSRVDEEQKKLADIHAGLDSTLMILQHRFKAKGDRKMIQLVKDYGELPLVACYAGQLNQVFMNLLANAIDALEIAHEEGVSPEVPTIRIQTQVQQDSVLVRIADNGPGMPAEVYQELFKPFFTTKPVGKGTGLGLSISHQIVVEKHGGKLSCNSAPGAGTEFMIEIPARPEQ